MKRVVLFAFCVVGIRLGLGAAFPFPEEYVRRYLAAAGGPVMPEQQAAINPSQAQTAAFANQYNNAYSQPLYPSLQNSDIGAGNYYPPIENMGINMNIPRDVFNQGAFAGVQAQANSQINAQATAQAMNTYPQINNVGNRRINQNQMTWGQEFYKNQLQQNNQHNNIHDSEFNINKNSQFVDRKPFQQMNSVQNTKNPHVNVVSQSYISPINTQQYINDQNIHRKLNTMTNVNKNFINTSGGSQQFYQPSSQAFTQGSTSSILKRSENIDSMINDKRIQNIVSKTQLRKRYLVVHPDGRVEHVDTLDKVIKSNPNYVLINSGRFNQGSTIPQIKTSSSVISPSNYVKEVKPQDIKKFSVTEVTSSKKEDKSSDKKNNNTTKAKTAESTHGKNESKDINNNELGIKNIKAEQSKILEVLKNNTDKKKSNKSSIVKISVKKNKSANNTTVSDTASTKVKLENKKDGKTKNTVRLGSTENKIQKKSSIKFSIKTTPKPPITSHKTVKSDLKNNFKSTSTAKVSHKNNKATDKTTIKANSDDSTPSALNYLSTFKKENQKKKAKNNQEVVKSGSTILNTEKSSIFSKNKTTNNKIEQEKDKVLHVIPVEASKKSKKNISSVQGNKKRPTSEISHSASSIAEVKKSNKKITSKAKSSTTTDNASKKSVVLSNSNSSKKSATSKAKSSTTINNESKKSVDLNNSNSSKKSTTSKATSSTTIDNASKKSVVLNNSNSSNKSATSKAKSSTTINNASKKSVVLNNSNSSNKSATSKAKSSTTINNESKKSVDLNNSNSSNKSATSKAKSSTTINNESKKSVDLNNSNSSKKSTTSKATSSTTIDKASKKSVVLNNSNSSNKSATSKAKSSTTINNASKKSVDLNNSNSSQKSATSKAKSSTTINNESKKSVDLNNSNSSKKSVSSKDKSSKPSNNKSKKSAVVNKETSSSISATVEAQFSSTIDNVPKKSVETKSRNVKVDIVKDSKQENNSNSESKSVVDGVSVRNVIEKLANKQTKPKNPSHGMIINAIDSNDESAAKMLQMFKGMSKEEIKDKVLILLVMPPIIDRECHTTVYPDGTVIDEITETTWDSEDEFAEPKVVKTTNVRHINDPPAIESEEDN